MEENDCNPERKGSAGREDFYEGRRLSVKNKTKTSVKISDKD